MNKISESQSQWGGNWTELKLQAFEKYVNAYLTIMNAQKQKHNGWPTTIYFDGFAGSGIRSSSTLKIEETLFADYFVNEESELYRGAAERVLSLKQKFDYYFFVDINKSSITLLEEKLKEKSIVNDSCNFVYADVNVQLAKLSEFINDKKVALVLLDPFGMQVSWESIELLKNKRVDLWILIPSGVIINRFLDRKGKMLFKNKLESYFGLTEDEIRARFYDTQTVDTLFGSEDITIKTNDSVSKIAELYIEKLKGIWKNVSDKPLILNNTKNVPIYHFVFASNNQTASKIAKQIVEKKSR